MQPINIIFLFVRITADIAILAVSFMLAYMMRFGLNVETLPPWTAYFKVLSVVIALYLIIFTLLKLYKFRKGIFIEIDEFFIIFSGTSVGAFLLSFLTILYRELFYSRLFLIYAWIVSLVLLTIAHLIIRRIEFHIKSRGIGSSRALIMGIGEIGRVIGERILERPYMGYKLVGFVKGNSEKNELKHLNYKTKIFGEKEVYKKVIRDKKINALFVAVPYFLKEQLLEIATYCDNNRIELKIVPDLFEVMATAVGVDDLDGIPMVGLKESRLNAVNKFAKRTIDVSLSLIGLAIAAPIIILFVLPGIRLTSKGPILYRQKRIGTDGKRFTLYKFRTMKDKAEKGIGAIKAIKGDARVYPFGSLLRASSLDELPQLYNVLKGDMSLVGPRPERPHFVSKYKIKIPKYMERHKAQPGITGWAQINGRSVLTDKPAEKLKYDLYYIENWSILLDLKIIFKTFFDVILRSNAF
jgi:exopolysaccharide biosynthesis polyprenyl glycosylphosphotransferase